MLKLRHRVDAVLAWVVVVLMGASVLNVLWQVASRYLLRSPSSWTEELSRYLLIWVGLVGAAYAVGQRLHLAIDLLPTMSSGRFKAILLMVIEFAILIFAATIMTYGGGRLVATQLHLGQTSAAMGVKLGHVYLALPISGVIMAFYSILNILDQFRGVNQQHGTPDTGAQSHGLE